MTAEDCGKMKTAAKGTHLTQKGMCKYRPRANNIEMSINGSFITLRVWLLYVLC